MRASARKSQAPAQQARQKIGGGGICLHGPEVNENRSIAGLMAGIDWCSA